MVEKKKAIEILEGLRTRILSFPVDTSAPEFLAWERDARITIQNFFPNSTEHANSLSDIIFRPDWSDSLDKDICERQFFYGVARADALFQSLAEEVRNFWNDDEIVSIPKGTRPRDKRKNLGLGQTINQRNVFVVHGRNGAARHAIFEFLRAIGLTPLEWSQIVAATGKTNPYIGEVLEKGFSMAQAVVVLLTPDDEARLNENFRKTDDAAYEAELMGQARPNVLFEAGMAMGLHPNRTILVEMGNLRPFTDVGGRHVVRLNNSSPSRQDLANRLKIAGSPIDLGGTDWHTVGSLDLKMEKSPIPPGDNKISSNNSVLTLTQPQSEIITATKEDGRIIVARSASHGQWVHAGGKDFSQEQDPSYQAKYFDALEELVGLGAVRHEKEHYYALTGRGFEIRKRLNSADTVPKNIIGTSPDSSASVVDTRATLRAPLPTLTPEEMEIIATTDKGGSITILNVPGKGQWIKTYGRDFIHQSDPSIQVHYVAALNSIVTKNLARKDQYGGFVLTTMGFEMREALQAAGSGGPNK
jgi:predicted nucleotide-binding protein